MCVIVNCAMCCVEDHQDTGHNIQAARLHRRDRFGLIHEHAHSVDNHISHTIKLVITPLFHHVVELRLYKDSCMFFTVFNQGQLARFISIILTPQSRSRSDGIHEIQKPADREIVTHAHEIRLHTLTRGD